MDGLKILDYRFGADEYMDQRIQVVPEIDLGDFNCKECADIVRNCNEIYDLDYWLEKEKKGKNRITVLDMLYGRRNKLAGVMGG